MGLREQIDALDSVTPAQLLKAVDAAIATIALGGQSYSIAGRTFTRASLPELYSIKRELENDTGTSSPFVRARFN